MGTALAFLEGMKLALFLIFTVGCGAAQQKPAINAALSNAELRPNTFEATARSLDEHPYWIDEFYKIARKHPKLMHRFLENAARDLHEPALAYETGELLAANPDSLQRVLVATVDCSKDKPESRSAIQRAILERHKAMADIMTDSPAAVKATMEDSIDMLEHKKAAREAILEAMRSRSPILADMMLHDQTTLEIMMDAIMKKAKGDESSRRTILKALDLAK